MTNDQQDQPPVAPAPIAPPKPAIDLLSLERAIKTPEPALRKIWLCADDYGISPKVSEGIRELILRGRINATSVMVVAPTFTRAEAMPLSIFRSGSQRAAVGLHVTLTAPFRPLSPVYAPLRDGAFPPLRTMLAAALLRRLRPELIAVEVGAQIRAFTAAFGQPPDFIDGHQHVHVFPQVRDGVIAAVQHAVPKAWIRQCARHPSAPSPFSDFKGFLIDRMSRTFRAQAEKAGLRTNPSFAGTYRFNHRADFARLFSGFLKGLPDGGVVMCHPGFVDDELRRLDPLTDLREKEYAYLAGEDFPAVLKSNGMVLA